MYLPHQAVIRNGHSSTKLRVVFDASAKKVGPSLNDAMYKGPFFTRLLFDVLVRFRLIPIGIIADCHCNFFRSSSFDDIFKDIPEEVIFRFCRAIFGVNCSQYLLNNVIHYHTKTSTKILIKTFQKTWPKFFTLTISILQLITLRKVKSFTRK